MYLPIKYKKTEENFLKRVRIIRKNLFIFLYVEKRKQFIEVHYKHQGKFSLSLPISFNFKSHLFVRLIVYSLSFYRNPH